MSSSSNEDEEPKVCTVFASSGPSNSKTVFDTIAFSVPKKETEVPTATANTASALPIETEQDQSSPPPVAVPLQSSLSSMNTESQEGESMPPVAEDLFSQEPTHPLSPLNVMTTSVIPTFDAEQTSYIPLEEPGTMDSFVDTTTTDLLPPPVDIFGEDEKSGDFTVAKEEVRQEFAADDTQKQIAQAMEGLALEVTEDETHQQGQGEGGTSQINEDLDSPIPTANSLFADAPEVPFPVGQFVEPSQGAQTFIPPPVSSSGFFSPPPPEAHTGSSMISAFSSEFYPHKQQPLFAATPPNLSPPPLQANSSSGKPLDTFSTLTYSPIDAAFDAWIPKEPTRKILMLIATAVHSGTYFPDKLHMTTPGIIYEDDLIDKVGVNMARIFGESEASKRRILTADSVTQDDNGLRELIKLGCYRSAINLTKRLLTLYGQGPGKVGQFSKHNPHTLQLWFTRITLLVRIREFAIAESEIDAFKDFDNPDLYYEYYPDSFGGGRKGSMVPFNFRLLAAEILQYSRKHNETIDRLLKIVLTVQLILKNIEEGIAEDGSGVTIEGERKSASLNIWRKREIRVYYSLANASLFSKDYQNTYRYLSLLCDKDKAKKPQLQSSIGRLFLQLGDLTTASKYFEFAADLRPGDSDSEQVENLVDSAMLLIAHGTYPEAFALLQQAVLIQPDNFMITNNMAVCLLYMGKVKDALILMETTVKNNTPELLQENVLLNLSTIYELENTDGHKKNSLLKLVSQYKGDGINLASLKMPNLI